MRGYFAPWAQLYFRFGYNIGPSLRWFRNSQSCKGHFKMGWAFASCRALRLRGKGKGLFHLQDLKNHIFWEWDYVLTSLRDLMIRHKKNGEDFFLKLNPLQGYQLLKSFVQMGSSHSKWIFSEVIIAFLMLFHESLNPASFLSCKGVCATNVGKFQL